MKIFLLSLFLSLPVFVFGQVTFQIQYSQPDSGSSLQTFDAVQTPDGGYAITGIASVGASSSNNKVFLAKLTCDGNIQWMKTFGNTQTVGNVYPKVLVTKDSQLVITNNTGTYPNYNGFVARLDMPGNVIWQNTLNLSNSGDVVNDIFEGSDGSLVLTGGSQTTSDVSVVKLTANGQLVWHKRYGNTGQYDDGYAITESKNGGYLITGRYISMGTFNALLMKTDSGGNMQWLKCYGDSNQHMVGYDVKELPNGDIIMVGSTTLLKPNFQSFGDNFITRLTPLGDTIWTRIFYGSPDQFENVASVEVDAQGNFLLGVATASYATIGFVPNKNAVMKFDGNGNLLVARVYNTGSSHYTRISTCADGTLLLSAFSNKYSNPVGFQTLLMKMDTNYQTGCFETDVLSQTVVTNTAFKITQPVPVTGSGATVLAATVHQFGTLTDSVLCSAFPHPLASFTSANYCSGSPTTFTANGTNVTQFTWHFGDSTSLSTNTSVVTHSYSSAGTYTVQLVYGNGCNTDSVSAVITIVSPAADLHIGNDTVLCEGQSINLVSNITGFPYSWSTGETTPSITVQAPGIYYLELNTGECGPVRDSITISTKTCDATCGLYMPNAFSPNGDNTNDYLQPLVKQGANIEFKYMEIRNRWGNLVYRANNLLSKWDGSLDGLKADNDTYYYFIRYKCEGIDRVMKGDVLLLR